MSDFLREIQSKYALHDLVNWMDRIICNWLEQIRKEMGEKKSNKLIEQVKRYVELHYAEEIRSPSEVPVPAGEVQAKELALAKQLIEQTATETFEPAKYRDTVRERVMEAIQRKIDGQDITADVAPDGGGKIIDLMEALKASLAKTESEEAERKAS